MDSAEHDVLAYMTFPRQHWAKLHSTNPIERLNGEIKRRTEVVGIFPNTMPSSDWSVPLLLEQNDEWVVQRSRYMSLETIATMSDDPLISLPRRKLIHSRLCPEGTATAGATPQHGTRCS